MTEVDTCYHIAPMRESVRNFVGEITLSPKVEGYLEAEMVGLYKGLLKLAVGRALYNVDCGGSIWSRFNPSVTIALRA